MSDSDTLWQLTRRLSERHYDDLAYFSRELTMLAEKLEATPAQPNAENKAILEAAEALHYQLTLARKGVLRARRALSAGADTVTCYDKTGSLYAAKTPRTGGSQKIS